MISLLLLFTVLTHHCVDNADFKHCPRDRSRVVRRILTNEIYPIYNDAGYSMSASCELFGDRDIYLQQELNKLEEAASKWVCQFCGKAFYEQRFLDMHFESRHADSIKRGADTVCLADYCDIFRCEVLSARGKNQPKYWDKALCRDKDLKLLQDRCKAVTKKCVPPQLSNMERHIFLEKLNEHLCDYLTCTRFWELPETELHPVSTALYIVATAMLIFGLLVYYYIAYTHFYTDESLLSDTVERKRTAPNPLTYYSPPVGQEIRYRSGFPSQ